MRRPLIAGNWKMHMSVAAARALARAVREGLAGSTSPVDVLVAPPFTSLPAVADELAGCGVQVAAQNMHWEAKGAFTGEISPTMLTDLGVSHVILGHSERRQLFGETDDAVGRKTRAAVDHRLVPIVCVGETLAERDGNRTMEVVERQVERGFRQLTPDEAVGAVIAYEPVWAIGTGKAATPAQAQEVHAGIRRLVSASHGEAVALHLRILYGGSVKPANAAELMSQPDIDGGLVGGACLEAESFLGIARSASPA